LFLLRGNTIGQDTRSVRQPEQPMNGGSDTSCDSDDDAFDMRAKVSRLIRGDSCGSCLVGKAASLETFVGNTMRLTPDELKVCLFTALTVLYVADDARPPRVRSTGERVRFHYYVPFVGRVCKSAFLECFGISSATLSRYRRAIRNGWLIGCE
jgi:hypothetical protein